MEMETLILAEIERVSNKLDALNNSSLEQLTEIQTKIKPLFPNGQPGIINDYGDRISVLENTESQRTGWISSRKALWGAVATILILLGSVSTFGLNLYRELHGQTMEIQARQVALDKQAREHQTEDNQRAIELQSEINNRNRGK